MSAQNGFAQHRAAPATTGPVGSACHAAAYRAAAPVNPDLVRAALAAFLRHHSALHPAGAAAPLWVEPVQAGVGEPVAEARRERELHRPPEPGRPPLRVVLLRYANGVDELVLVARRDVADRAGLDRLAAALLPVPVDQPAGAQGPHATAAHPARAYDDTDARERFQVFAALARVAAAEPGEQWGNGTNGARLPGVLRRAREDRDLGRHRFELTAAAGADTQADLLAALALTVAVYSGRRVTLLGTNPPTGRAAWPLPCPVEVIDERTVAEHRSVIRERLVELGTAWSGHPEAASDLAAGLKPAVGLLVTGPTPGGATPIRYVACLEPVHSLTIHIEVGADLRLRGTCHFRPSRLAPWLVEQFARHLAHVHWQLVSGDQGAAIHAVQLLAPEEQRWVAALGRPAALPAGAQTTVHGEFAARASERPDAPAVSFNGATVTYSQLDDRANRLAHALRGCGVGAGSLVGICVQRSSELIAMVLAVLKAGGAYVPMEPHYPAARLAFTAEDARLNLVVAEDGTFPRVDGVPVLSPAAWSAMAEEVPTDPLTGGPGPDDPAYVIFTSGSTGRPKGVVVPHRNVVNLLAAVRDDFGLAADDVWTMFHSVAFDFSIWETWGALLTGGRLVVVPHWVTRMPDEFRDLLISEGVTVLSQTPCAFAQMLKVDRGRNGTLPVRLVVFGGEPLDTPMLIPWFDRHPESRCRLVNMFGITETTVHVTAETVTRAGALVGSRAVGAPIPGWYVYVVDQCGRLLPPGVTGEILVGGAGVATGYLNRPELTAERFVADPWGEGRVYRSGDLGRFLPDGRLEHLGRIDSQVKVRGHRIELDEIRSVLLGHTDVVTAAVVLRRGADGDPGEVTLDAYVVLDSGGDAASTPSEVAPSGVDADDARARAVRRHAQTLLPDFMVPATVTPLATLPLTTNGKLDVARLPPPLIPAGLGIATGPAPVTALAPPAVGDAEVDLTARLRQVWESVLHTAVGPDDNLFDLGGNSLLAVRISAMIRARGLGQLPLRELYRNPTVRAIADHLACQGVATPNDEKENCDDGRAFRGAG